MERMTKRQYLRFGLMALTVGTALAAIAAWWFDGAWESGAMPTHGASLVLVLAGCGLICFLAAAWVERDSGMARGYASHEDLNRSSSVETGSDRAFGGVFAVVFAVIGLFPLIKGELPHWWALALAGVFLVAAVAVPRVLAPLNRLWAQFGAVLHRIVTPLILGLVFYTTVTPIGIVLRVLKKEVVSLKFEPERKSYWIDREAGTPEPETMKNHSERLR